MKLKNQVYTGSNNRKSLYDLTVPEYFNGKMILFLHGYKGYKDWGCWNLLEAYFVRNDFGFCKFNFSHNGGTIKNGIDFPDLEAFGNNRYSYEVNDVKRIIDLILEQIDTKIQELILIGHSRGGGIATLVSNDKRINKLITLASISDIESRFPKEEKLEDWKKAGVYFVKNGRTQQEMPHKYSFYKDYFENEADLNIIEAAKDLTIPCLHIHGDDDTSVLPEESQRLANYTKGTYFEIKNTQHTFDSKHPWTNEHMPNKMKEMCEVILNWVQQ